MFARPLLRRRPCWLHVGVRLASFSPLVLGGCATTGGSARYETMSVAYARSDPAGASTPPDARLGHLRGPTLERSAFVRAVLDSNPTLTSARQSWRAALARVRQAGAFEDPMLDVGLAPLSVGSSAAPIGYEIGLSQRLPWFGKRALEADVAQAEAEATRSDYEGVKRELALTAITLYDQYFVNVRSLEINAAHTKLMRTMRDHALAQFSAGRGSAQDSLQAEVELTHLEHDAVILATERDVTLAQMNELLHRAPELPLPPPPADLKLPPALDVAPAKLEAEAVQSRPEITAARQHARAEQARAERAEREYYPDFTLSTSYNSMWEMPEHRWMVGLGFNLPIQSGKRGGAADEARAMRAQQESDALRLSDAARTQVFVTLKRLSESQHLLGLYETRLLPVAKDQIDAAHAGFVTSQTPFAAVLEAEKNLRKVELDYQMARADYARRRGELDRALGRLPGLDGKDAGR
jgi:outer membrane protein, heavy metal efflux system